EAGSRVIDISNGQRNRPCGSVGGGGLVGERGNDGWIVDGIDGDAEGSANHVVTALSVIYRHGDERNSVCVRARGISQSTRGSAARVVDSRNGNEGWVAGRGGNGHILRFIGRAGADPGQWDGLRPSIFINRQ